MTVLVSLGHHELGALVSGPTQDPAAPMEQPQGNLDLLNAVEQDAGCVLSDDAEPGPAADRLTWPLPDLRTGDDSLRGWQPREARVWARVPSDGKLRRGHPQEPRLGPRASPTWVLTGQCEAVNRCPQGGPQVFSCAALHHSFCTFYTFISGL